jgi:hypothetical protein
VRVRERKRVRNFITSASGLKVGGELGWYP